MQKVVIVSACRTPVATIPGVLSAVSDVELMAQCFKHVLKSVENSKLRIQYAFTGSALPKYRQNICRKAVLEAGLSETINSATINKRCASGMEALFQGIYRILSGDADSVLVGAVESSSQSSYALGYLKENVIKRASDSELFQYDKFIRKYNEDDMVVIVEKLAREYSISKQELDKHTLGIYQRAREAVNAKTITNEVCAITNDKLGRIIDRDAMNSENINLEVLQNAPVFSINDGMLSLFHSAKMADGAAAVLLMSEEKAKAEGYRIQGEIAGQECCGIPFDQAGKGVTTVTRKLLTKYNLDQNTIGLFEFSEAFSVQSLLYQRLLGIDPELVNIRGSEIALGYAMGSTSLRICVSLLYSMIEKHKEYGIAATTAGGCMGQGLIFRNCIE